MDEDEALPQDERPIADELLACEKRSYSEASHCRGTEGGVGRVAAVDLDPVRVQPLAAATPRGRAGTRPASALGARGSGSRGTESSIQHKPQQAGVAGQR